MASIDLALKHAAQRIALGADVREEAARAWAQIDRGRIAESWLELLITRVLLAIFGGQRAAAAMAQPYAGAAAASSGLSTATAGVIQAASFAGAAADGRSMLTLMLQPVITTLTAIGAKVPVTDALALGAAQLDNIIHTEIADAGRTADQVAMIANRSVDGYIRVVVGDTCSRCIILAGRWYPVSQFFERHPSCDCVQMPAKEAEAAGLIQDPREIYESLTTEQRTKAGWSEADQFAIDEGADIVQVTNVRRKENGRGGVYTAGGKQYTREGTTRAGLYGGYDIDPETGEITRRPRGSKRKPPRLTPQQIFEDAENREDAIRKLRQYGYLLGTGRTAEPPTDDDRESIPEPAQPRQLTAEEELEAVHEAARERQRQIDALRDRAEVLAEIEQLAFNEAEERAIRHRIRAGLRKGGLEDDPLMAPLADADVTDYDALRSLAQSIAAQMGLTRLGGDRIARLRGRFGDSDVERGFFRREIHKPIGSSVQEGELIDILRPGYRAEVNGREITLFKADVIDASKVDVLLSERPLTGLGAPDEATEFHLTLHGIEDLADMASEGRDLEGSKLSGGQSADTRLVELPDGRRIVHKRGLDWGDPEEVAQSIRGQADSEQLAAVMAEAIGARVARVFRNESDAVWMEYIDSDSDDFASLLSTTDAIRMGLLDVLVINGDRNEGNILVRNGELVGIDHGWAWAQHLIDDGLDRPQLHGKARPSQHFVDDERQWKPNPLHPDDIAVLRSRISALRPAFDRIGRGDWHAYTLRVLAKLAEHASGTERLYG